MWFRSFFCLLIGIGFAPEGGFIVLKVNLLIGKRATDRKRICCTGKFRNESLISAGAENMGESNKI